MAIFKQETIESFRAKFLIFLLNAYSISSLDMASISRSASPQKRSAYSACPNTPIRTDDRVYSSILPPARIIRFVVRLYQVIVSTFWARDLPVP